MNIKLEDVARRLGVSKATVSLALNGSPRVNERTGLFDHQILPIPRRKSRFFRIRWDCQRFALTAKSSG